MLNHPDPLPAQADIAVVAAETGLSLELVERIHEHLVEIHEEPPDARGSRACTPRTAPSISAKGDSASTSRCPPTPTIRPRLSALRLLEKWAAEAEAWRKRRRPRTWTKGEFQLRYVDACRAMRRRRTRRARSRPHFVTLAGKQGIDPDHLRRLIRRFGVLAQGGRSHHGGLRVGPTRRRPAQVPGARR